MHVITEVSFCFEAPQPLCRFARFRSWREAQRREQVHLHRTTTTLFARFAAHFIHNTPGRKTVIPSTSFTPRTHHTRFILMLATCNMYRAHIHAFHS